ncbi:MAG: hypothetical protein AAF485_08980 [Chloroflexota bacterium]
MIDSQAYLETPFDIQLKRKLILVDFFSKSHRFSANVDVSKLNVVDSLNNSLADYIEVTDLYVSRISQPDAFVDTCRNAYLSNYNINFEIIPKEQVELSR